MGGSIGPCLVGFVTQNAGDNLKAGMLAGCVFPAILLVSIGLMKMKEKTKALVERG